MMVGCDYISNVNNALGNQYLTHAPAGNMEALMGVTVDYGAMGMMASGTMTIGKKRLTLTNPSKAFICGIKKHINGNGY